MSKDEALKLALEALENTASRRASEQFVIEQHAVAFIKQVLAQPKQEPVAWIEKVRLDWLTKHGDKPDVCTLVTKYESGYDVPLYTIPPQRKPLTAMEVYDVVHDADLDWHTGFALGEDENRFVVFARAIEAAHGIYAPTERKGEA